jgi:hypothetical protein
VRNGGREYKRGRDGVREPILIQGGKKREGPDRGKANVLLMCCQCVAICVANVCRPDRGKALLD